MLPTMQELYKFSYLILVWSILFFYGEARASTAGGPQRGAAKDSLEILFFANTNALLENCHCGSPSLGGLARMSTILTAKRQKNPEVLIVDGGDFLNSYSFGKLNLAVLQMYHILQPDILTLGDQEFVEGANFLRQNLQEWDRVVGSNFILKRQKTKEEHVLRKNAKKIRVLAYLDKSSFDVIPFDAGNISLQAKRFERLYSTKSKREFLIIIFHGTKKSLQVFIKKHPKADLILAGHAQIDDCQPSRKPAIVYGGEDGRYIYDIRIYFNQNDFRIHCKSIPVKESIRQDRRVLPILKKFKTGR